MILASNNAHKLEEFRAIFADMGIEIIPQSAAGCHFEVDETGETFEENAYLKAIAVTRATWQPAVADDSGLMVDALGGAPGVHSARYATDGHDFAANNRLLLRNLAGASTRRARFRTVIALILDGRESLFQGAVEGCIAETEAGCGGFGYDPLFVPEGCDRTFAEMTDEQKNALSHRGRAVRKLAEYLHNRTK